MNIRDIAKMSGVGVSTVSRVLNNHPDVKKETRDKILEIIRANNYVPNSTARMLKSNNLKHIGVLVKGVFNPFFSEMLKHIENKINQTGYTMILHHYDPNDVNSNEADVLISFIREKRLQGVIGLGGNFQDLKKQSIEGLEVPIVLTSIDKSIQENLEFLSSIGIDNEQAGYEATKYLIDKGHKHIAVMLGEEFDAGVSNRRALGYIRALEEADLEVHKAYFTLGGFDYEPAYRAMEKLLKENNEVTAIFAMSDIMAIGCCRAIIDAGLRVPEDIAVIGFDDLAVGKYYNPPLTTIKQPQRKMAAQSIDLLLALIEKKTNPKKISLETKLVERKSV